MEYNGEDWGAKFVLEQVLIAVISSLIASVIIYIATVFYKFRMPSLLHIIMWRKFEKDITICVTEIKNPYDTLKKSADRRFSLVPFGEVVALKELDKYMDYNYNRRLRPISIQNESEFSFYSDKDLIILGGPRNNFVSRKILEKLDSVLVYQFARIRINDKGKEEDPVYKSLISYGKKELVCEEPEKMDYGLIIYCKNPYNTKRHIILCGGLSQCSTLATTMWIQKIPTMKMFKYLTLCDGFEAVISCKSTNNQNATNIKLIDIYEIKLSGKSLC